MSQRQRPEMSWKGYAGVIVLGIIMVAVCLIFGLWLLPAKAMACDEVPAASTAQTGGFEYGTPPPFNGISLSNTFWYDDFRADLKIDAHRRDIARIHNVDSHVERWAGETWVPYYPGPAKVRLRYFRVRDGWTHAALRYLADGVRVARPKQQHQQDIQIVMVYRLTFTNGRQLIDVAKAPIVIC